MDPHPELLGMVGRLAGDYCPHLPSTDVVTVARSAFTRRGRRPVHEVEATVRDLLDQALLTTSTHPVEEDPDRDHQPLASRLAPPQPG